MLVQPTTPELNMLQQHQHSRETHRLTLKIVMNIFQFIAFQLNVVLNKMHRKKKCKEMTVETQFVTQRIIRKSLFQILLPFFKILVTREQ